MSEVKEITLHVYMYNNGFCKSFSSKPSEMYVNEYYIEALKYMDEISQMISVSKLLLTDIDYLIGFRGLEHAMAVIKSNIE